ncbi:hypothetical protein [Streptococcus merionis]|uniref:hypothetical protein n=1 Tax=Streptococcus merionis TaxID=400065 RepID=UPI0035176C83
MRKIISLVIVSLSVIFLVACGSNNMDGVYREFYQFEGHNVKISNVGKIEINGEKIEYYGKQYSIDEKDKTIKGNDEILAYSYDSKTEVLTLDGNTYVRVDSDYYKELISNGADVLE